MALEALAVVGILVDAVVVVSVVQQEVQIAVAIAVVDQSLVVADPGTVVGQTVEQTVAEVVLFEDTRMQQLLEPT